MRERCEKGAGPRTQMKCHCIDFFEYITMCTIFTCNYRLRIRLSVHIYYGQLLKPHSVQAFCEHHRIDVIRTFAASHLQHHEQLLDAGRVLLHYGHYLHRLLQHGQCRITLKATDSCSVSKWCATADSCSVSKWYATAVVANTIRRQGAGGILRSRMSSVCKRGWRNGDQPA